MRQNDEKNRRTIDGHESKVVVLANDWRLRAEEDPKLILCIWGDGYIVWSENQTTGGSPYRKGRIAPDKIVAFVELCKKRGFFEIPKLEQEKLGPDSQFTTVKIQFEKDKKFQMSSWHELQEKNGALVALDKGVADVGKKTQLELLMNEPAEYLHYRLCWAELRNKISKLIPSDNDVVFGSIVGVLPKN